MIRRLLALVLMVAAAPRIAHAQRSLGVYGGATVPSGDLAAIDNPGYHLGAMLETVSPGARVGLRLDGSFHSMSRKATIQDISERIAMVAASAVFRPPATPAVAPYLLAGLGMYNQSISPQPIAGASSTDMGFNLGIGVRFALGGVSAFSDVRFHRVMADGGARFVPVSFGVVF